MLINTLLIHKFMALPTPQQFFFEKYRRITKQFIWGTNISKIGSEISRY